MLQLGVIIKLIMQEENASLFEVTEVSLQNGISPASRFLFSPLNQ